MPRARLFAIVALSAAFLTLGGQVGGSAAAPGSAVRALRVAIPPPATLRIADFRLVAKPGVALPARLALRVANRAQLAKTIVAAAVVVRSPKTHSFDVLVIVLRRRTARTTSSAAENEFMDALIEWADPPQSEGVVTMGMAVIARGVDEETRRRIEKLFETPATEQESLVGLADPDAFVNEVREFENARGQRQVDLIIQKFDETIHDNLIGTPKKNPPTLYSFAIPAFDVSFTGPAANDSGSSTFTSHSSAATGCGDPATSDWAISTTTSWGAAPINDLANFSVDNPYPLVKDSFDANGTTGSIKILLHYVPGTPATIAVETTQTGDITQVTAPAPLPVTLTKVPAC